MRILMSGYAGYFNRGHNRQGHLFQNRYKSTVCKEERNEELHWPIFVSMAKNVTSVLVTALQKNLLILRHYSSFTPLAPKLLLTVVKCSYN